MDDKINETFDVELINEINVESILQFVAERMQAGASYIDCILSYSELYDIDIEVIGEIVRDSPVLMSAVHEEAESLNLIEKINRLPV